MKFEKSDKIIGLVYVPEVTENKKHPCPNCFSCQICSDTRCYACLKKQEICKN